MAVVSSSLSLTVVRHGSRIADRKHSFVAWFRLLLLFLREALASIELVLVNMGSPFSSSSSSSSFSSAVRASSSSPPLPPSSSSPPPPSSSSPPPREKYDVFISFRGENTREGFTSFLYEELRHNQIQAYMDDHEFETGDEISPTLMNAIESSKISVVIFSEDYASSTWCLKELVKILECKKSNRQIVLPVFYKIDAFNVRQQTESYAIAFAKHEKHFNHKTVNQWREALVDATHLNGLDSRHFR
ncbi:hypothetical protein FNV43_RR10082 [Rhamnella rubrinervis]|uniref:TIR domain-containing protein n=1 Tax=Rhamnella rubrinervis TaxID=2594499 RepID=A0A8K0HCG2_9ROSA|nr:hypothetical protein FNV43_RR10082 [Rhamnella rubrinervis]